MGSLPLGGIIAFGGGCDDGLVFGGDGLLLDRQEAPGGIGWKGGAGGGGGGGKGGVKDAKAAMALKSHSEAERRRRERINSHLDKLKSLVPTTSKLEKAALLAEVIEQVKELKSAAAEISKRCTLPSDTDELVVEDMGDEDGLLRVSLCCDLRPELLTDLKQTLRAMRLRTVRAEIATLGGRVKNVFVVTAAEGGGYGAERHHTRSSVEKALRGVLDRASSQMEDLFFPVAPVPGKRRRFLPVESLGSCS